MPILQQCSHCKKLLSADKKVCESRTGKGCGKRLTAEGRIYYIQYMDDQGKTKQKKIGPHKEAALNELRKRESSVCEGRYIDKKKECRVSIAKHVDEDYLPFCRSRNRGWGLRSKEQHLKRIKERWGAIRLDKLTTDQVEAWRVEFAEQGKEKMWNRIFQTLRAMYHRAVKKGVLEAIPFLREDMLFREEADRVRWLTEEEEAKLLEACADHLRPIVLAALYTGLRKSDLLSLRLGTDVDLESRLIHRRMDKTGEAVDIYIVDVLFEELVTLAKDKKPGDLLFTYHKGKSINDVKVGFNAAVKRSGILDPNQERIKDLTFHDLRHGFASRLVKAGVDLYTVQKLLGHKKPTMTQRYAHLAPDAIKKAMAGALNPKPRKEGKILDFPAPSEDQFHQFAQN